MPNDNCFEYVLSNNGSNTWFQKGTLFQDLRVIYMCIESLFKWNKFQVNTILLTYYYENPDSIEESTRTIKRLELQIHRKIYIG